jgi:molybdate transport system substrate-binding protein
MPHRRTMTLAARLFLILALALSACGKTQASADGPVVMAPSSLQEALEEVADAWAARGHDRPVLSFAGSPVIARQIQGGAPADIVVLADEQWMDVLEAENLLADATRLALLGNRLVLVSPLSTNSGKISGNLDSLPLLLGQQRLAMADPDSVPAGRYGKMALQSLGLWDQLSRQIAPTENVRAALALVERGEAPFGLVYASDLAASDKVRLAAEIPEAAQPPIRYPAALLTSSTDLDARAFLAFLTAPEAEAIFAKYQFVRLAQR